MASQHIEPSVAYARDLTERIKRSTESLYELLLEAWQSQAYKHLGYRSWNAYIDGEFDFNRQHSYFLINQAKVTNALRAAASEVSYTSDTLPAVTISGRDARSIAPILSEVVDDVRELVSSGVAPQVAVEQIVAEVRAERAKPKPPRSVDCEHEYVCRFCGEAW